MRRMWIVAALALAAGCGGRRAVAWDQLAASEAVQLLKAPDNPYRVIYSPPVDLAKQPGS